MLEIIFWLFFCNIYRLLKELPHLLIKRRPLSMMSTCGLVVSGIGSKTFKPYLAKYIFVRVVYRNDNRGGLTRKKFWYNLK